MHTPGRLRRLRRFAGSTVVVVLCSAPLLAASAVTAATPLSAGARPAAAGSAWGTARELPGMAALNQGGGAGIGSVSCASAGSCSAGGGYADSSLGSQVFVVARQAGQAGGRSGTIWPDLVSR